MDAFTDYYAVLGVDADASADKIKAAFKKLALQYHPDVYKGADAQERMRILLLAYPTYLAVKARHLPWIYDVTTDPIDPPRYDTLAKARPRDANSTCPVGDTTYGLSPACMTSASPST